MYFFSEEYRLNSVLNQEIEEISITEMDLLLSLKNGTKILNGTKLAIEKENDIIEIYFDNAWKKSDDIHKILGQKIVSICQNNQYSIKLKLSSDWSLILFKGEMDASLLDVSFNNYQVM